jgi:hypothetical protein
MPTTDGLEKATNEPQLDDCGYEAGLEDHFSSRETLNCEVEMCTLR